jgi:hypothetical protein
MTNGNKDTVINIRVNSGLKTELTKLAERDRRTLSDYITLHLETLIEKIKKK